MRGVIRRALIHLVIPVLDRMILWAFGWRRVRLDGVGCGPHYIDPRNPDCYLLRDAAVRVAMDRSLSHARRGR
ncbi:hypothetical protein [Aquimonas sp.]|jgi:hypothetical protein|uniref:hypothetical protein n=1 Tax=Aquimonas sp. TaxID=1872588 RepID=UPI0037C04CD7